MLNGFEDYLALHTHLPAEEISRVSSLAIPRALRRKEFLFRAGEICWYKVFIVKGLLRTFHTAADGREHILHFSPQQTWTLDVESYDRQEPSRVNIAAIEPSDLLLWRKADFDGLLAQIPDLKNLSQQLISHNIYSSRQRMLTILSGTPEEKYADFVQHFPDLLSRLPLHMIAAYLGISLKTLTRIRHAQLQR